MKFKLSDIEFAIEFVSSNSFEENEAWLCKDDGKIYYRSSNEEFDDLAEQPPQEGNLMHLPSWQDLNLGKRLVMKFAMHQMPDDYDTIQRIFSRKGAYGRLKVFLHEKERINDWYEYQNNAQKQAIRNWCEAYDVELAD